LLGESLVATGHIDEGAAVIDSSMALINSTSERFAHSDVCRIKGDSLLANRPESKPDSEDATETARRNQAEAEDFLRQAVESARIRQAKSIELRAVISLSRLLQNQGRKEEARQMLSEICGWFTEGGDTMDLKIARALLLDS
jgi:hypothetical protein